MDIQYVKGVGPALAKKLAKLNLRETRDVLNFFPTSYQDRRQIPSLAQVPPGKDQFISATIAQFREQKRGKFHLTIAIVNDASGEMKCVWFNQPFLKKILRPGMKIFCHGVVEYDKQARVKVMKVSEYEPVDEQNSDKIIPIYPLTRGVYQRQLRQIIWRAMVPELKVLRDPFSADLRQQYDLMELSRAIFYYHYPKDRDTFLKAKKRLVFEDFFYLQLALAIARKNIQEEEKGIAFQFHNTVSKSYFASLPYQLTGAQQRVIDEVYADMQSSKPMNRLVQGDVGAGKTEVAMAAILLAIENDYQVAIMAPTAILAYQHYQKMIKYLLPLGIRVEYLVGSLTAKNKTRKHYLIKSGSAQVVVGTHAVIQEKVQFDRLGLAIIDEQHRFGVLQRSALMHKGQETIDLLVVTATPIPRSLTLTLYGDLSRSIIDEMPPGRTPIETVWIRSLTKEWIKKMTTEMAQGHQIYWVFPLVEESAKIDLKAATEGKELIQNEMFPDHRVALLHGRMKQQEKDQIMKDFREHKYDILVATTVIEVGVDVPDATMMVIEHAERFGLSQLHQLRGRIGRSDKPSTCLLLSTAKGGTSKQRLSALVDSTDGFALAEVDLELRGPGDYFGAKQSGLPTMFVASLIRDEAGLKEARRIAQDISSRTDDPAVQSVLAELRRRPYLSVGQEGMN